MTKQRQQKRDPIGKMSFVERAGFLFGVVGLLADFTVLFTFATGVSNLNQYLPKTIPTESSLLFFSLTTALIIIYGWFAVSWYLVRRTFVLLGQMPIRFNYPLTSRSLRTVAGVGFVLIPLTIAWSVVNVPDAFLSAVSMTPVRVATVTPSSLTQIVNVPTEVITPQPTSTPETVTIPLSEEERVSNGWIPFFMFCYPFFIIVFGFVVWLPINLLMPIIHVELLLRESAPDILDELREYLEE